MLRYFLFTIFFNSAKIFFTKTLLLFPFCSGGLLHWKETENVTLTMKLFQNSIEDLDDENVGNE